MESSIGFASRQSLSARVAVLRSLSGAMMRAFGTDRFLSARDRAQQQTRIADVSIPYSCASRSRIRDFVSTYRMRSRNRCRKSRIGDSIRRRSGREASRRSCCRCGLCGFSIANDSYKPWENRPDRAPSSRPAMDTLAHGAVGYGERDSQHTHPHASIAMIASARTRDNRRSCPRAMHRLCRRKSCSITRAFSIARKAASSVPATRVCPHHRC